MCFIYMCLMCVTMKVLKGCQMALWDNHQLLACGDLGEPGIKTQAVVFFMQNNKEKLGISFCDARGPKLVSISPGLANLINGSTFKTTMKRKSFDSLPEVIIAEYQCRIMRTSAKTIVLIPWGMETPFAQACKVLKELGKGEEKSPRTISIDAMVLSRGKYDVADFTGCLKASRYHEVVVYEDRGENLTFLKTCQYDTKGNPTDILGYWIPKLSKESGTERFQKKIAAEKAAAAKKPQDTKPSTKADMGVVKSPEYKEIKGPRDHYTNAYLEFKAIIVGTIQVNQVICKNILEALHYKSKDLLKYRLKKADAAVYNNDTSQIIEGNIKGEYMAAYNGTNGFVVLDRERTLKTGQLRFQTPQSDPIVVITNFTKNMLEDKILKTMEKISGSSLLDAVWETWILPNINWINGVPGCGKTTWVLENFNIDKDVMVTTTTEAANYLEKKLEQRFGDRVKGNVRTMNSILANGWESEQRIRLMVDKSLMYHFGAIVMATRLVGACDIILIGDVNQLTYTDGNNLFKLKYSKPSPITTIKQELLCTHRNPMDVAYALNEIYPGIYSSSTIVQSIESKRLTGTKIPTKQPNTLFLVHTEKEKVTLSSEGYGSGEGSRILTIDEAQALKFDSVIIIRTKMNKRDMHDSIPHAVVAVSRHTRSCIYYTDYRDEAIDYFVGKAEGASTKWIADYNLKMAVRNRDNAVIEAMSKAHQKQRM